MITNSAIDQSYIVGTTTTHCHAQYHAKKHLGQEKCEDTIGVMRNGKS